MGDWSETVLVGNPPKPLKDGLFISELPLNAGIYHVGAMRWLVPLETS